MRFQPGQSGNRAGRPRGYAGVAKQILSETGDAQELVDFALRVFRDEERPMSDRLAMLQWLSDRALGKPLQSVDLVAEVGVTTPQIDVGRLLAMLPMDVIETITKQLENQTLQLPSGD